MLNVEEVRDRILAEMAGKTETNWKIWQISRKISQGKKVKYADALEFARETGKIMRESMRKHLPDVLTNGMLFRSEADQVLRKPMEVGGKQVAETAAEIQKHLNEEAGIHIRAIEPELNEDQINGIITDICNADSFEAGKENLFSQIENFLEGVVDDCAKENADFHYEAGLSPRIVRQAFGKCCEWCSNLAGTYEYAKVRNKGNDVFRRHKNCHCIVNYDPGDGAKRWQNVHTREWTDAQDPAMIERRKQIDQPAASSEHHVAHGMANGPRRAPMQHISKAEERQIRKDADNLGIPQEALRFNNGKRTSYDDRGWINIRGDIFPADYALNPESILNERCALAHEYYGHMMHSPSRFNIGDWRDEFEASYFAALDTPNLTDQERRLLMIDAFERPKAAGVKVTMNKEARRIVYGFD